MENRRRRSESELPDVIIQHIHSFLETIEAAKTMIISKSWLRAWSTRPFLDFNSYDLQLKNKFGYIDVHCNDVIDRTLKSYFDLGTPIVRLCLDVGLIEERWLRMLRRSNVIELDLAAHCNWTTSMFQEIFLTQSSLQVLRVFSRGYRFQLVLSDSDVINCVNLRELNFQNLLIPEVTLHQIMFSCPLIEELGLEMCRLRDFSSYNLGFQYFMFSGGCKSLKRLSLIDTDISDELLHSILSKSPQLEDLNLIRCSKLVEPIKLSSFDLKRLHLDLSDLQVVSVDAPNLHKLKFSSSRFWQPRFPITITSPITRGVVKVTITYHDEGIDESWFHGLMGLLAKFAKSNVKLTSYYGYPLRSDFKWLRATPLPPQHEVETLRFKGFSNLTLLYAFFTICHPKTVILNHLDTFSKCELLIKLLKDLSYRENLGCCSFNKCWRHYIKDAKLYYVVDNENKPLDVNGLKAGSGNWEAVTLALEWESSD